jgi:hypothetical protein
MEPKYPDRYSNWLEELILINVLCICFQTENVAQMIQIK